MAKNREELFALAEETQPSVIITEIDIPVKEGLEAIEQLIKKHPCIPVIAYSRRREIYIIDRIVKIGVRGYVSKTSPAEEILWAVKTVAGGGTYFCTGTISKLKEFAINGPIFTKSQFAILAYICEGKCDKEIAMITNLSCRTIEGHRANMKRRLGVTTTAGIITYAFKGGLYIASFLNVVFTFFWEDSFLQDTVLAMVA
ncbi:MAG TPA: response regulator transcription factor [Hanamia sp.]|nr:response regulator transcription factor [Hanamia sp.]